MKSLFKRVTGVLCSLCFAFGVITNIDLIPANAAIETTIYGDVNNSGSVDVSDVVILSRYIAGDYLTSNVNMKYADVDKNTVLDTNDTKIILKYILHLISSLPYSESGSMFNYNSYTVPTDEVRDYKKYNCSTGSISGYTLSIPSSLSSIEDQLRSGSYDDRILDSSAEAQCIVYLSYKKSNGSYYRGSGFIVDDHVIATCAHCLYDGSAFNTDYKVKIYNTAGTSVVATYNAKELHIPLAYYNSSDSNYDYGLIYVNEDLSQYGKMALGQITDNFENTAQTVYASGFPKYVHEDFENPVYNRYIGQGTVTTTTNNYKIWYTSFTSGGDSGGPVFLEYTLGDETFRTAIGIITNSTGVSHWGNRITLPISRFFYYNSNIG